tara:strand:+ start:1144 stop:1554 length:411 start_codon:yes stop_codon:yes gene_type:complete
MAISGNFPELKNSRFDVTIEVGTPISGFNFAIMQTGLHGSSAFTGVKIAEFSGREGYLFDQSGNFFGGYQSGVPFDISVHYNYEITGFSYYFGDVLMANNITSHTGIGALKETPNHISGQKYNNSTFSVFVTGDMV